MISETYKMLCTEMDRLTHESMHHDALIAQIPVLRRQGLALAMAILYSDASPETYIQRSEYRVRNGKSYFMGDN